MSASGQAHESGASGRRQRRRARWVVAARNFGWKISKNAWDAGINDLSASRRTPIRRVIAGRRGVTVIEGPFDDGTAEAGTIAMPSPRDTKSKSELNWLVMILWLNTTPRSLVAISSVRRNPESLGIEIMGSSMQIECGSGNTAEDVGNLSGRQSRCNRGFHQVAHTRISFSRYLPL